MYDWQLLDTALKKCEIYLGNTKIDKTDLREFKRLIADNFFSEKKLIYSSIPASDIFLGYLFVIAGLLTYVNNKQSVDDYIQILIDTAKEDCHFKVTYGGLIYEINPERSNKNEIWLVNAKNRLKTCVKREYWNQISDYAGNAENRVKHYQTLKDRVAFYDKIFGDDGKTRPIALDAISYIVVDKKRADQILSKLYIGVRGLEKKKFRELFTVGYRSRESEEFLKYPGSLGEQFPSIGICNDLATIKDWIKDYGDSYPITMLYVADWTIIQRDKGFIQQIFANKVISLQMYNFSFRFGLMKEIRQLQEADVYWGLTPLYLEYNPELIDIINTNLSGTVIGKYFSSSITSTEYQEAVRKLRKLRKRNGDSRDIFVFLCHAIGLIRRLRTDCFCTEEAPLNPYMDDIRRLEEIQESIYDSAIKKTCSEILAFVKRLYEDIEKNQYKYMELKKFLVDNPYGRKLLIVPYQHQCNAISSSVKKRYNLDIATPLKIDDYKNYDLILVSGTFSLKDFPIFLHLRARRTIFFLYEFETLDYTKMSSDADKQLHDFDVLAGLEPDDGSMPEAGEPIETVWDENLDHIDFSELISRFHSSDAESDIIQSPKVGVVRMGLLDDGRQYLFSKKNVMYLDQEKNTVRSVSVKDLTRGMSFLYCRDFGNRQDVIRIILKEEKEKSDDFNQSVALVKKWKSCLMDYMEDHSTGWNELSRLIGLMGYPNSGGSIVRSWILPESSVIGPRDNKAYQAIKKIIAPYDDDTTAEVYQEATETVRRIHNAVTKKITKILPQVYKNAQQGIQADTSIEQMLQDNLNEFVEVLTLSDIRSLDHETMIPGNYVNKPLESEDLTDFE